MVVWIYNVEVLDCRIVLFVECLWRKIICWLLPGRVGLGVGVYDLLLIICNISF